MGRRVGGYSEPGTLLDWQQASEKRGPPCTTTPPGKELLSSGTWDCRAALWAGGTYLSPHIHSSIPAQPPPPGPTGVHTGCRDHPPPPPTALTTVWEQRPWAPPCSLSRAPPQFLFPLRFRFPTKHCPIPDVTAGGGRTQARGEEIPHHKPHHCASTALGAAVVDNAPKGHYCRDILVPCQGKAAPGARTWFPAKTKSLPYLRERH